jgi:hypothetical protein
MIIRESVMVHKCNLNCVKSKDGRIAAQDQHRQKLLKSYIRKQVGHGCSPTIPARQRADIRRSQFEAGPRKKCYLK